MDSPRFSPSLISHVRMTAPMDEKTLQDARLEFARLDMDRPRRRGGFGEAVFGPGKTKEQLLSIFKAFMERDGRGVPVLATRCTGEQADFLKSSGLEGIVHDPVSRTVRWLPPGMAVTPVGEVAVCTGGTADIPVAEEAAVTAEFLGAKVSRFYDVGVAGLHRLLGRMDDIRRANAIVAVAGMEGALAGVVAGMVDAPVIAVPTSVGYGASFGGLAPLLTMLNSCAEGVATVNIDNGYGAGYLAAQINRKAAGANRP